MESLCLTCLSNVGNGVPIPPAIADFLQDILRFKVDLRKHLVDLVCFSCYKTICEMKRFYQQLQDVQHYFDQVMEKDCTQTAFSSNTIETITSDVTIDGARNKEDKCVGSDKTAAELYEQIAAELDTADVLQDSSKESEKTERTYRCENCCRIFETTESFRRHVKWHLSHGINTRKVPREKKFKCSICGKRFRTSAEKRAHDVTHTNLRPFKCEICPKTFRQLSGLSVHRAVHFGKRVECPDCGKRFATKFELTRHSNVHKKKPKNRIIQIVPETEVETEIEPERSDCTNNNNCDKMYENVEELDSNVNLSPNLDDETVLLEEIVKEVQQSSVEVTFEESESLFIDDQSNVFLNNADNEYVVYKDKL